MMAAGAMCAAPPLPPLGAPPSSSLLHHPTCPYLEATSVCLSPHPTCSCPAAHCCRPFCLTLLEHDVDKRKEHTARDDTGEDDSVLALLAADGIEQAVDNGESRAQGQDLQEREKGGKGGSGREIACPRPAPAGGRGAGAGRGSRGWGRRRGGIVGKSLLAQRGLTSPPKGVLSPPHTHTLSPMVSKRRRWSARF